MYCRTWVSLKISKILQMAKECIRVTFVTMLEQHMRNGKYVSRKYMASYGGKWYRRRNRELWDMFWKGIWNSIAVGVLSHLLGQEHICTSLKSSIPWWFCTHLSSPGRSFDWYLFSLYTSWFSGISYSIPWWFALILLVHIAPFVFFTMNVFDSEHSVLTGSTTTGMHKAPPSRGGHALASPRSSLKYLYCACLTNSRRSTPLYILKKQTIII